MMRYAKLKFKASALQGKDHSLPSTQRNKFNLIFQITRYTGLQFFSGKSKDQIDDVVMTSFIMVNPRLKFQLHGNH